MKQKVDIGVVCLARKTFDFNAAKNIYDDIKISLNKMEDVNFHFIEDLVIEVEDAKNAALYLNSKNIDALVVISGTFHLGHLILELVKVIDKPVLLWGLNELPYNGGKIRLNSVCGVNLNASNLYKAGYDNYYSVISDKIDEDFIDAIRIKKALSQSHIGIVGYRAHGFFNLDIDELNSFKKLNVLIDHYELNDIYSIEVDENNVKERLIKIRDMFDVSQLNSDKLYKVAQLCEKIKAFVDMNKLNALAVRCWPEFAADFGISPCAAMSILQSEDYILSCEGDIEGAISMLSHRAIGAKYPFLADLSQVDLENDYALLWHCGVAPCNLWDGKCVRSLDTYFAGGKGVTADFVMKDGDISILRFDSARGKYRIFLQRAKGIPMEKLLKGTYVKVRFENNINEVLNKVIYNGIAHHVSVVYGDFIKPFKIYAKLMNFEVIE